MKTDNEILARIQEITDRDWLGFERNDLICRLPFESAKPFLKEDYDGEGWRMLSRSREDLITEMLGYMPFAWDKANSERGLSAGRSMSHYNAWVWLAGDDLGDLTEYDNYGKDNLRKICEHYGWDYSNWE